MRFHRNPRRRAMKRVIISMLLLGGFTALSTMEASAVVCARVYTGRAASPQAARLSPQAWSSDILWGGPLSSRRGGGSLSAVEGLRPHGACRQLPFHRSVGSSAPWCAGGHSPLPLPAETPSPASQEAQGRRFHH